MSYLTGHQLKNLGEPQIYSTGIIELDNLLSGGLQGGEVVEIFGKSSVGKSWLSTWLACRFVTEGYGHALFIDTQSCISSLVVKHYFNSHEGISLNPCSTALFHCSASDMFELFDALEKVKAGLDDNCDLKLVIIDSLASIISQNTGSASLLCLLSQAVKHIAKKWGVCVLLVCGARDANLLGDALLQVDLSLELKYCQEMRKIEVINSNRSVTGLAAYDINYGAPAS